MTRGALCCSALVWLAACGGDAGTKSVPVKSIPGHDTLPEDTSPKQGPRLVPPEVYIKTYLSLFGGLSPIEVQAAAQATDKTQLFDSWNDYLASLGLPDYRIDIPRATQTNALMLATFERLGVALCDRALERDLMQGGAGKPQLIFAFDAPDTLDEAGFGERFDVLHRTFLGYPAKLAPDDRVGRFFTLYNDTVARHAQKGAPKSRFTPAQAGWASVCYGLVRHPEFHLY
jgi:hypothetical protein